MSTAALMQTPEVELLPLSQPQRAFRVHEAERLIMFEVVNTDSPRDALGTVSVNLPFAHWNGQFTDASVSMSLYKLHPLNAKCVAEVLNIAAWVAMYADADRYEQQQRAEEARRKAREERRRVEEEYRERRRVEQARRDAVMAERYKAVDALIEDLKYQVGENIRLQRHGKRSTVFGTIQRIYLPDDKMTWKRRKMDIITERGKPMEINLTEVSMLEVKDPETDVKGMRSKWERIYPAPAPESDSGDDGETENDNAEESE